MLIFLLPLIVGLLVTPNLCDDQKNNCTSSYNEYKKIVEALLKPGTRLLSLRGAPSFEKIVIVVKDKQ